MSKLLLAVVMLALAPGLWAQSGHDVLLSWDASITLGVTYNVYRGTDCMSAQKINLAPVFSLTYTDSNVPAGTLCYFTTSFLESESVPSNTSEVVITSTVPPPPPPATGPLTIQPPFATISVGTIVKFTAYRGTVPDTTVRWSLRDGDLGMISADGLYMAPANLFQEGNNVEVEILASGAGEQASVIITLRKQPGPVSSPL